MWVLNDASGDDGQPIFTVTVTEGAQGESGDVANEQPQEGQQKPEVRGLILGRVENVC